MITMYMFVEFWTEKSLSFFGQLSFFGLVFFSKMLKKPGLEEMLDSEDHIRVSPLIR